MRKKITFIGSGSVVFTRNLVRDILTYPALADCEIAFVCYKLKVPQIIK